MATILEIVIILLIILFVISLISAIFAIFVYLFKLWLIKRKAPQDLKEKIILEKKKHKEVIDAKKNDEGRINGDGIARGRRGYRQSDRIGEQEVKDKDEGNDKQPEPVSDDGSSSQLDELPNPPIEPSSRDKNKVKKRRIFRKRTRG